MPSETELVGRGENKKFMYQLVNNKKNGIDVDKVDNVGKSHNFLFYFFIIIIYIPLFSSITWSGTTQLLALES